MPETLEPNPFAETFARPEALLRVPVGLASPLWGLFAGAAIGGSAWWWMTRWSRPENLEALFGGAETPATDAPAEAAEAVVEAVEAIVEARPEPHVSGAAASIAAAPTASEAAAEPPADAATEPKPRARRAEAKAD